MPFMSLGLLVGGSLLSSAIGADAATSAADTQAGASKYGIDKQLEMSKPWLDAGKGALEQLTKMLAPGSAYWQPYSMSDTQRAQMNFSRDQGIDAIQNSAAAKGGLLGTNTMRDITQFGQDNAAKYQNQGFNQWLAERESMLKPVQSLAQVGQSTSSQVADNVSNLTMTGANARAGGIVGSANAITGGIGNIANQYSMYRGLFGGGRDMSIGPSGGDPNWSTNTQYDPNFVGVGP